MAVSVVTTRWSWRSKRSALRGKAGRSQEGVEGRVLKRQTREFFNKFLEVPILIRINTESKIAFYFHIYSAYPI